MTKKFRSDPLITSAKPIEFLTPLLPRGSHPSGMKLHFSPLWIVDLRTWVYVLKSVCRSITEKNEP